VWAQRVPVDFSKADQKAGAGLPSAWARQKIEDLSNTAPKAVSGEKADDLREQITEVALDYHLMSPYTSFVAVEPTVVNIGGQQKTLDVPVEMADGVSYDGIFGAERAAKRPLILKSVSQNIGGATRFGVGAAFGLPANLGAVTQIKPVNGMLVPGAPRTDALENRMASVESRVVPPRITFPPAILHQQGYSSYVPGGKFSYSDTRAPTLPSAEEFAQMTPEARLKTIRALKMSVAVAQLAAKTPAAKVAIQFWLSPLADDKAKAEFAAKLKALGWTQSAVLTPGKLVLGEISSDKLDEMAALEGVRLVEVPRFK